MTGKNFQNLIQSTKFILLAILILAVAVRIVYLGQIATSPIYQVLQIDSQWYAEYALRIAGGELTDGQPFYRAPLYPYFLAAICKVSGNDFGIVRIIQHLMGAAGCAIVFLIADKVFDRKTAVLSAIISIFYGPLIHFESRLMATSLGLAIFLLALLSLCYTSTKPSFPKWLGCGLLLGWSSLARPNFLVLIPLVLVWWLVTQKRTRRVRKLLADSCAFGIGAIAGVMPATLHNVLYSGEWILIASQGGVQFYIGNNPSADGKTVQAPGEAEPVSSHFIDNIRRSSRRVAQEEVGKQLSETEVSQYWFSRGLKFWRESPGSAAILMLKKVYYFFNGFEIESIHSMYLDGLWSHLGRILIWEHWIAFPLGVVFPLAILGMFFAAPENQLAWLLRLAVVIYSLSIVAFFVSGRLRMQVVPLLIIFAAYALCRLHFLLCKRQRTRFSILLCALLLLGLLSNSVFFQVRAVDYPWQVSLIANAHLQLEEYDDAARLYRRALDLEPDNFTCRYNLGGTLQFLGRSAEAKTEFLKALRLAPNEPKVHNSVGGVLLSEGKIPEAIEYLLKAIELGPALEGGYINLAIAYRAQGKTEEAISTLGQYLKVNSDCARVHYLLAVDLEQAGNLEGAWHHLQRAQQLGIIPDPQFVSTLTSRLPQSN